MLEDFTSMHPLVIVYMLWKESEDCCALQTSCKLIQHTVATFVHRQWSCVANAPCTEALHHSFEHGTLDPNLAPDERSGQDGVRQVEFNSRYLTKWVLPKKETS